MQQHLAAFKPRAICEATEQRYFEDYIPGAAFEYGEIRVDEAEILEFARRFDPQDMHVDPEAAKCGRFGGLIASGWHTGAMMMRLSPTIS
ncbi:MAG TPA: MaoC/PaaZ C-terminal domain-containing protein [Stellaceae bacterium]|jgi:acyl dehydratase|nr:MaoC/PaaZ C-terminal domain-containing protein [Stellaceae bacterium]